jgi:tetratricopeptide (TPR) repeat protein
MRRIGLLLVLSFAAHGAGPGFSGAQEAYQRADYRAALATLLSLPVKDAGAFALIGKAYYMDGQYKNAASYFEKAVAQDAGNASFQDWLGKAYGRRAEQASFVTAISWANKTRAAFEKAVALGPANLEALGDLFEYYLEAPGIVGGGLDKAEGIAQRTGRLNEAEYHYMRARLAERRKETRLAEQELRQALQLAPDQVGRVIDVARFMAKQGRYDESDALFRRAERMAPDSPKVLFARAETFIETGRNLEEAKGMLRRYAAMAITPDDPPRSEVTRLLERAK